MTRFLILNFVVLGLLSVVAVLWSPQTTIPGKTNLIWVSDPNPMRTPQISAFNDSHPDLNLVIDPGTGAIDKVVLQCSSGVGPDLFDCYDDTQLQTYVESGVAWDVTQQARDMGFSSDGGAVWPNVRGNIVYEGKQYGYPCNTGTLILLFNKNIFDYYGIAYPTGLLTWEQFIQLALQVNSATAASHRNGPVIYGVISLDPYTIYESLRGEYFSEDGTRVDVQGPELKQAYQMYKDCLYKYHITPSLLEAGMMSGQGGWGSGALNQFAAGRFAMILTGQYALNGLHIAYDQYLPPAGGASSPLEKNLNLGALLAPRFADHPPAYRVGVRSTLINARSPHRQQALAFLQYLTTDSYSIMVNQEADNLPGNPREADRGVEAGPPGLDRIEIHEVSKQALGYGYVPRPSPFLLTDDVLNELRAQTGRLESNPSLSVDDLLAAAQANLDRLMQRNLDLDPLLMKRYVQLTGRAGPLAPTPVLAGGKP